MNRRHFLTTLAAAPLLRAADAPTKKGKVVKLFKSPDGNPNALEATPDGLWIGEQCTDRAYLVDWKSGKVKTKVETEASNTSGIAYGAGSLWMGSNGNAIGRPARPTDSATGAVVRVDPKTGKTLARHPIPGGGGVHGLEFADGKLWVTSLRIKKLSQVDPETFQVLHQIPVTLDRAHGLAWDPPAIWCMFSTDRVIHKLDAKTGAIQEIVTLTADDPDPHGMCIYKGSLYYCDAGIAPGAKPTNSPSAGYVCRIDF